MPAAPPLARETVDVEIAGWTYKITKLGALTGRTLMAHIVRAIGPAFDGEDHATRLCAALKDDELDYVCKTLAKETRISKVEQPDLEWPLADRFDTHFSGHYGWMVLWVKACLEANYGNFLGEIGVDVAQLKALVALAMSKASPTESPSTGPSGAASVRASEA